MKRYAECLIIVMVSTIAGSIAAASDLPRYKFEVGQQLTYAGTSDFDFGSGAFHNSDITRFWVTAENSDGSWHLLFVNQNKEIRTGDLG